MEAVLAGIAAACAPTNLLFIAFGVSLGILVGAIPGLSSPMAIAIAVPLTYAMHPVTAIAFLLGVHKGGEYGGAIASILINTPGEVSSALTALDGHPLAKKGLPRKALLTSLYSSVAGDVFADTVLILVAAPLAIIALKMGPPEILGVLIFAFAFVSSMLGKSMLRGLIAATLGVLVATVGLDPESSGRRLTFGFLELDDGVSLPALAIGLLAMGEVLVQIEEYFRRTAPQDGKPITLGQVNKDDRLSLRELWSLRFSILRGSAIGTVIGAMPGLGASVAAFIAYGAERRSSRTPEEFGKGKIEGIAAIESANNAVIGSSLIPLLTLGIPGSATAALIVGAFIIHGVTPGPFLFDDQPVLIYGLFASLMIANLMNLVIGNVGLRFFALFLQVPRRIILGLVTILCFTGAYIADGSVFSVAVMLIFAVVGYFMRKLDFSFIVFLIGYILGPLFERSLRHTVILTDNLFTLVVEHPLLPLLTAIAVFFSLRALRAKKQPGTVLAKAAQE